MNLFPAPVEIVREKKAKAPQVSVIVTLYNYGHYLDACLDSIRAQTQGDIELIVIDRENPFLIFKDGELVDRHCHCLTLPAVKTPHASRETAVA